MPKSASPSEPSPDVEQPQEGSSTASSAAEPSGFFADAGPGFDEDAAGREPAPEPQQTVLDAVWEEETIRGLLTAQGAALHSLAGKGEEDWVYTRQELRAISGPLTRILNRYPVTQAAAGTGDEIAVLLGLGGYVTRSIKERRAVLASSEEQEGEEVRTGGPVFPESPATPGDVVDFPVVDA